MRSLVASAASSRSEGRSPGAMIAAAVAPAAPGPSKESSFSFNKRAMTTVRLPAIITINRAEVRRRNRRKRGSSTNSPWFASSPTGSDGFGGTGLMADMSSDPDEGDEQAAAMTAEIAASTRDGEAGALAPGERVEPSIQVHVDLADGAAARLDKALADHMAPELKLSRSRLRALIAAGAVVDADGGARMDPAEKLRGRHVFIVSPPAPRPAAPRPQPLALAVVFEDSDLVVVDKPAGMATHPAPGAPDSTLVNALLHHCGDSLSGVGGELRPGIVHRLDKDTSGLLVAAKSDAAHQGLSTQFAARSIERRYVALVWGAPEAASRRLAGIAGLRFHGAASPGEADDPVSTPGGGVWGRFEGPIGRSTSDRKRMAVRSDGKAAATWFQVVERFAAARSAPARARASGPRGAQTHVVASRVTCRLETGRTHQIRVHLSHLGHGLLGDPVYGRDGATRRALLSPAADDALKTLTGQALHAETLGFAHPVTGASLRFEAPPPPPMARLIHALREGGGAGPASCNAPPCI